MPRTAADDHAVSPVIAIILLVAITVLIAGAIYVMGSQTSMQAMSHAPAVSWRPQEELDRISVVTASAGADWHRVLLQVDECTVHPAAAITIHSGDTAPHVRNNQEAASGGAGLNDAADGSVCGAAAGKRVGQAPARIMAGDFLDFCAGPSNAAEEVTGVLVSMRDTPGNAVLFSYRFADIARCGA